MTMTKEKDVQETPSEPLVTYEMAEKILLESKNPRMRAQYEQGIVNPIVLAQAVGCRPQMIYNYIKQGKIRTINQTDPAGDAAGIAENSTQKIVLEWEYAVGWVQRYLNKKAEKQAAIEAELRGDKP
jgi:hypothetical protein